MFNTLKTIILLGCLSAMIIGLGGIIGGKSGIVIAFGIALTMNIGSYWFSDKIALAAHNAQPLSREEAPELFLIVERLANRANIPVPPIYLIPTDSPNAFATGRDPNHAAVAVTAGILRILDARELEGVLAHELGHVRNRDVLITTVAAVLASVITYIAHWGMYFGDDRQGRGPNLLFLLLLSVLAPIGATIVNLAISRSREYEADHSGAELCGHPMELASALSKIEQSISAYPMRGANPAFSSLYIANPDPRSLMTSLLCTHPPTEERIRRLKEMAREKGEYAESI